ncbi:hypothetical protein EVAR_29675_1 [Eumeta japonica]|uniref:Uncharacterized protein n=1 Tax=Eumeta variegata TaxID=151549 RepID=A0A4C1W981_EUMVA|nr:hypothetical protein EVAR_29675_1 [Eumeta japonica]
MSRQWGETFRHYLATDVVQRADKNARTQPPTEAGDRRSFHLPPVAGRAAATRIPKRPPYNEPAGAAVCRQYTALAVEEHHSTPPGGPARTSAAPARLTTHCKRGGEVSFELNDTRPPREAPVRRTFVCFA